jgi:two-component system nitrate/nitrite response regulator NarL
MSNTAKPFSQSRLSLGEIEMLSHVLRGHSNKTIAQDLGLTEAAAKGQLESFLRKINVDTRTHATIWALQNLPEALAGIPDSAPEARVAPVT